MLASLTILLLDSHLKALAVLLCGSLLSRIAGRGSATQGHRIRAAAFALALGAPILAVTPLAGALVSVRVPEPTSRVLAPAAVPERLVPMKSAREATHTEPAKTAATDGGGAVTARVPAGTPPPVASRPDPTVFAGWGLLVLGPLWLSVAMLFGGRLAALHAWLALRLRRANRLELPEAHDLAARIAGEYALTRVPDLKVGSLTQTPFVWGFLRPVVVLPPGCGNWDAMTWEIVLRHELAHVQRRDCLWQFVSQLVCFLNWFNPLVWRLAEGLRRSGERACDERVLASGIRASSYAGLLLSFAGGKASPAPVLAMAGTSDLPGRIDAILRPNPTTPHHGERSMKRHALIVAAMLAALVMVDVRLSADDKQVPVTTATGKPAEVAISETPVRHLGEAWNAVAWAAHGNELWEGSALGFMNASRQAHDAATSAYNAACAWSRLGKGDESIEWLRVAGSLGWDNACLAREDADLENARKDPRFAEEVAKWEAHGAGNMHDKAHRALAAGLKAADRKLSELASDDSGSPAERDAREERLRAGERAQWQAFIEEVLPIQQQLPDDGEIRFRLGYAMLVSGRAEEALPQFEAALKAGAEPQKSQYNIACCLATMGRTDEAVAALEKLFGNKGEQYWNYPVSPDEMRTDYDLRAVREVEGFKALMRTLESGGSKTNPTFKKVWNHLQNVPPALATPIQEG